MQSDNGFWVGGEAAYLKGLKKKIKDIKKQIESSSEEECDELYDEKEQLEIEYRDASKNKKLF